MTAHTSFICDGCEKDFPRSELIEWGMDTHYCRKCAKSEIEHMMKADLEVLPEVNFDDADGKEMLEAIFNRIKWATFDLFERKGME